MSLGPTPLNLSIARLCGAVAGLLGCVGVAQANDLVLGNPDGIAVSVQPVTEQRVETISLEPLDLEFSAEPVLLLDESASISFPTASIGAVRVGLLFEQVVLDEPSEGEAAWLATPSLADTAFTGSLVSGPTAVVDRLGLRAPGQSETTNMAAAVGYAGFTISGAFVEDGLALARTGQLEDLTSWQAGLAYETGSLGLSLTYVDTTFDQAGALASDRQSWMLGGLFQLAPNITLNARAFYVDGSAKDDMPSDVEGTGGTVGVRLKF